MKQFAAVVEVAVVLELARDGKPSAVTHFESGHVAHHHEPLARIQHRPEGKSELDARFKMHAAEVDRRPPFVEHLEVLEVASPVEARCLFGLVRCSRVEHDLRNHEVVSTRGLDIDKEGGLGQCRPLAPVARPALHPHNSRLQVDGGPTRDASSFQARTDEHVGTSKVVVQPMDRQQIVADLKFVQVLVDNKRDVGDRDVVVVQVRGGGIPGKRPGRVVGGDPAAVEVCDETVVVFHPQNQSGDIAQVSDLEGNAEVDTGVLAIHLRIDVEINV